MKSAFLLVLTALTSGVLSAAPLLRKDGPDGIPDNYIVVLKKGLHSSVVQSHFDSVRAESLNNAGGKKGFVRSYEIEKFRGYHIECDEATLQKLQNHEHVDYITHDGFMRVHPPASLDPAPEGQLVPQNDDHLWGLGRISHRQANITGYASVGLPAGGKPSIAYVLDSGIRTTHHEFGGRASWGKTFVDGTQDDDEDGHGTHVAGIIMGDTTGVDNTTLAIAVKVANDGKGLVSGMIAGLDWIVQHARNGSHIGRSVINISMGGAYCQGFNDAVEAVVAAGITVVIAAGNAGIDACGTSPASAPNAITVGAIDSLDNRVYNYGHCVDIFAPGVGIRSTFNRNNRDYAVLSGTSMASPHVAGLAAYLTARKNLTTPQTLWDYMRKLATPHQVKNAIGGSPNLIGFNGGPESKKQGNL